MVPSGTRSSTRRLETKKITLTPNLLRDDNAPRGSSDSKEPRQRPSFDKPRKDGILGKEDKKKKDKKPSAIRSFFSRKDKKARGEEDDESPGKRSLDVDATQRAGVCGRGGGAAVSRRPPASNDNPASFRSISRERSHHRLESRVAVGRRSLVWIL